jgi:hypothetical protein
LESLEEASREHLAIVTIQLVLSMGDHESRERFRIFGGRGRGKRENLVYGMIATARSAIIGIAPRYDQCPCSLSLFNDRTLLQHRRGRRSREMRICMSYTETANKHSADLNNVSANRETWTGARWPAFY